MAKIVVGGVIKKDDKYLLVQEAQEHCRGKWNIPAGKLNNNETIIEGAKREIFEECGLIVDITGIVNISNRVMENDQFLGLIFSTEIIGGEIKYNPNEILDVKWFTYDEIISMKDNLRSDDLIIYAIDAVEKNKLADLELVKIIK